MNKLGICLISLPALVFITLIYFLWRGLALHPEVLPSALVGKPAPRFYLRDLLSERPFTEQAFKGQLTIFHVWATWCSACEREHPFLMEIKNKYSIPIDGLVYKDKPQHIQGFLAEFGNPYDKIGDDAEGEVAMDFGVYGTPETFLLDQEGRIVYRHVGALNEEIWERGILPLIKLYRGSESNRHGVAPTGF